MIYVNRGLEPQAVTDQRALQLPLACDAFDHHGPTAKAFKNKLRNYDVGKRILYDRQHRKCAYCERKPGWHNQPLEHFRPKAEALRHMPGEAPARVDTGYWWLTWTWENQLFSCTTCNGPGAKSSYFPLAAGTTPMTGPKQPCNRHLPDFNRNLETPMLLDPSDPNEDLLSHLRWVPTDRSLPLKLWTWKLETNPKGRGEATMNVLHLDELEDDVNDVYKKSVWPQLKHVLNALQRSDKIAAQQAWTDLHDLVDPTQAFTAATWWQLAALHCYLQETFDVRLAAVPGREHL